MGFLGPGDLGRHVAHAREFWLAIDDPSVRALDLGSGGGLPGLVLAVDHEHTAWTFLDANLRRTTFLREACSRLGLSGRVEVVNDRAEVLGRDPGRRGQFDVVVARSFGAPAVTAECAAPFLRQGGRLVVSEPPEPDPARWPPDAVARLGMTVGAVTGQESHFQVLDQMTPCPAGYPRARPQKRPLF